MTELETYQNRSGVALSTSQDLAVQRLGEWAHSAQAAYQVAENLVRTSFVPEGFRGKPHEATAAILSGLEVGLSPMAALRSFDVIQGTAAPRAVTLRAIVQSAGHEMEIVESNATRCKMRGRRRGATAWQEVAWTIDRAKALKLTGKSNWQNQPQAMLVARATSELARLIAADAILGIGYSSEEIADGGASDTQVTADTTAPTTTGTRKMSRATVQRPATEPEQPADEPQSADPDPITQPQIKKMAAAMNELGMTDRDMALAYVADVIGRSVESRNDLTKDEASRVIDALERDLAGEPPAEIHDAEVVEDELPIGDPA